MKNLVMMIMVLALTSCSEVLLLGSIGGTVVSQSPAIKAYNGVDAVTIMKTKKDIKKHVYDKLKGEMTDKLYEATKKEVMSEHEEYKNADVPKEIWIERNKYLHQHIDMLTEELIKVRLDNKKLSKQIEDQIKQFRNTGGL